MDSVSTLSSRDQTTEIVVSSTGEIISAIDTNQSTALQMHEWIENYKSAVEHVSSIEELDIAEASLAAIIKRLRQLNQSADEAEFAVTLTYKRIGDIIRAERGVPQRGGDRGNQYTGGKLLNGNLPKSPMEKKRDWMINKIASEWKRIEPVLPRMKKRGPNAVLREILRMEQKAPDYPDDGEAVITHASWETWLPQQPQCDVLLTDPPYSTDVDDVGDFASTWLPVALNKVKPTGRAYVCIGAYPQELMAYMSVPVPEHLILSQVLVWTYRNTLGPTPKYDYFLNWQAILYYRGVDAPELTSPEMLEQCAVIDLPHPARSANRWHRWQKPDEMAKRLIRQSTKPGDLILDPFAGSGTHLVTAAALGRRGYGCEIDAETVEICKQRGCRDAS